MILTVLCDNNTYIDRYYLAEPAFSCLIEDGVHTILYDAGYSDVFLQNAKSLRLDLSRVTDIALSHGHNDHTRGLPLFFECFHQPVDLYAHPRVFEPKHSMPGKLPIGAPLGTAQLPEQVRAHLSEKPQRISEHVAMLGEIPRKFAFENGREIGETLRNGIWETDRLLDDTALALSAADGLFIASGCAHSGVCNIVSYAQSVFGEKRIAGFLGGTHLFEVNESTRAALETLVSLGVKKIYPCHCTGTFVKAEMIHLFDVSEVGVSLRIEIPDGSIIRQA